MKTLFKTYYLFLLLTLGMLACQDEENKSGTGEIQFAINDLLQNSSGRTAAALPEGASLLISIEDASGNAVLTLKKLDLLSFGDQYTSAPLKLENGDYKLTDFLIVDETNAVVYATPHAGSPFASLVTRPLPVSFSITTGKSTSVPTQVVRANEATPEDFGYATFPVSIAAYPEFAVSVFAFREGELRLTSAQAYLLHAGDTIYRKYLGPQVSDIVFKGEQDETYTFVLVRPGFAKYSRTFVLSELREELDDEPLEVILQTAITMSIIPSYEGSFSFSMSGVAGKKVTIDWGNGYFDNVTLSTYIPEEFGSYEYWSIMYPEQDPRQYFVTLTGDLDAIQELGFGWNGGPVDLALQQAINLQRFGLHFNYRIQHLDLTANQELRILAVGYASVTSINIANNKKLSEISLAELPLPTTAVDKLIDDLYSNVVETGTLYGALLMQHYDSENDVTTFLGPPSPASIQKLHSLEDNYSWSVGPNF